MKKKMLAIVLSTLMLGSLVGCESIERSVKNIDSELGGLERTLTVYDYSGNELRKYEGEFDLKVSENGRVVFDLDGKRNIIYNAIVIAEEK